MGAAGVEALCAGLQKNTSILELLVAGNKANDDTLRTLETLLRRNRGEVVDTIGDSFFLNASHSSSMPPNSSHQVPPRHPEP